MKTQSITIENQSYPILTLKGRPKALLDRTVAEIYGVETKHINQAIKRNIDKFPPDFYYQLTKEELQEVITNCDHLDDLKYSPFLPYAFTHLGCNMLATILKSEQATRRAVEIIRVFTTMESSSSFDPQDPLELISLASQDDCYSSRRNV